ncbi:hypothetical protein WQ59_09020 [Streptomyces sp. KE1]|nr:hypothetical protein WQ59_09020 [Streptomyces sp. KE1]
MKPVGELRRWGVARVPGLRFSLGGVRGDSGVRTAGPERLPGEGAPAVANVFALNLFATNMFVTVKW